MCCTPSRRWRRSSRTAIRGSRRRSCGCRGPRCTPGTSTSTPTTSTTTSAPTPTASPARHSRRARATSRYPGPYGRDASNAADLVEFRIAVTPAEVAYRFTLNSLLVADSTMAVVAFDTDRQSSTGSRTLTRDPGAPFPGTDAALFVWGTGAEWSRWTGSRWAPTALDGVRGSRGQSAHRRGATRHRRPDRGVAGDAGGRHSRRPPPVDGWRLVRRSRSRSPTRRRRS